ncbi:hypothetical protein PQR71_35225 [Paraburkholderia fungorum]|uniref:hypothetical protein n=1 Tax=Paraburkholderia fungorum TaxID=134537 RepID=UPI0038BD855F
MMIKNIITLLKAIPRAERRAALRRSAPEVRAKREAIFLSHVLLLVGILWTRQHPGFAMWLLVALFACLVAGVWTLLIKQFFENLKSTTAHQFAWGVDHVRN